MTNKPLQIIIAPENREEFINFYLTLKNFSESGIDVPAPYVKRLLELMVEIGRYRKNKTWEKAEKSAMIATEKLKKIKAYQFNWSDTKWKGTVRKNDTKKIFTELIYAFFLFFKEDRRIITKDDVVAFFYQAFDDQYKNRMKGIDKKKFTIYKQTVTSGILALAVGYKLSSTNERTNAEIYQAARNAIRKYKKDLSFQILDY